jgi:hypothetical protein
LTLEPRFSEATRLRADHDKLYDMLHPHRLEALPRGQWSLHLAAPLMRAIGQRATPYRQLRSAEGRERTLDEALADARQGEASRLRMRWLQRATQTLVPERLVLEERETSPERGELVKLLIMLERCSARVKGKFDALRDFTYQVTEESFELNLAHADLRFARLSESGIWLLSLPNAVLRGAHVEGMDWQRVNLDDADLTGACIIGSNLVNARLRGASLVRGGLVGSILGNPSNFKGANLHRVNLINSVVSESDFLIRLRGVAKDFDDTAWSLRPLPQGSWPKLSHVRNLPRSAQWFQIIPSGSQPLNEDCGVVRQIDVRAVPWKATPTQE